MTDDERTALVGELRDLLGGLLRPVSVYMEGYYAALHQGEKKRVDTTITAILAAIEPAIRADEREAWERELSAVMPCDFKDWHQNDKSEWPMIAAAVIRNAREREEIVASRAERAEAEVERLRAALQDIANSDDIENALDPERNKRVARTALAGDAP